MFVGDGWDIAGGVGDSVGEGPDVEARVGGGPGGSRVGGRLVGDVPHADKEMSIPRSTATLMHLVGRIVTSFGLALIGFLWQRADVVRIQLVAALGQPACVAIIELHIPLGRAVRAGRPVHDDKARIGRQWALGVRGPGWIDPQGDGAALRTNSTGFSQQHSWGQSSRTIHGQDPEGVTSRSRGICEGRITRSKFCAA